MSAYRNVAAVVAAVTLMQAGSAIMFVSAPLALQANGAGATAVGVVVAFYSVGFLFGAVFAPRLVAQVGHIRSLTAGAGVVAAVTLGLHASPDPVSWALLRLIAGMGVALILTAAESWIADVAPPDRRGALVGFYLVCVRVGLIAGPFMIVGVAPNSAGPLMIAAGAFALCLVPVALTRRSPPATPQDRAAGPLSLWRIAPAAFYGALATGLVNGAVPNLIAVYAAPFQPETPMAAAASFSAALFLGGLLAQWPAGAISDRVDRRVVGAVLVLVSAVASLVLAVTPTAAPPGLVMVFLVVWGVGAMSVYGVMAAHAADRAPPGEVALALAGMLVVWGVGSVIGPIGAGVLIAIGLGPSGLFVFSAVVLAVTGAALLHRRAVNDGVALRDKSAFAAVPNTSMAAAELDPRAEADVDVNADLRGDDGEQDDGPRDGPADDPFRSHPFDAGVPPKA